jgi:protein gp37
VVSNQLVKGYPLQDSLLYKYLKIGGYMNKTKIEWCDQTLNPIVGCKNNCNFCYAEKMAGRNLWGCEKCRQFIPHPHFERLDQLKPIQEPKRIFICSMSDWNSKGVEEKWIHPIIDKMTECSQHTFLVLSKIPKGFTKYNFPKNVQLGTSITSWKDIKRLKDLENLKCNNIKFVSIEPLHRPINYWFDKSRIDWLIIGAETGNRKGKIKPEKEWIELIISNARAENIPLFLKDNLKWPEEIREFPNKKS